MWGGCAWWAPQLLRVPPQPAVCLPASLGMQILPLLLCSQQPQLRPRLCGCGRHRMRGEYVRGSSFAWGPALRVRSSEAPSPRHPASQLNGIRIELCSTVAAPHEHGEEHLGCYSNYATAASQGMPFYFRERAASPSLSGKDCAATTVTAVRLVDANGNSEGVFAGRLEVQIGGFWGTGECSAGVCLCMQFWRHVAPNLQAP